MKTAGTAFVIYILVILFLIIGWVQCLIKFVSCDFKEPYKAEIVYGIGTFTFVIGGIVGWMNIEDGTKMTTPAPATTPAR